MNQNFSHVQVFPYQVISLSSDIKKKNREVSLIWCLETVIILYSTSTTMHFAANMCFFFSNL